MNSGWEFRENPAWEGRTPDPAGITCHDGTPFMTIRCSCGEAMHLHLSQIERVADGDEVGSLCHGCGNPQIFVASMMKTKIREAWGLA